MSLSLRDLQAEAATAGFLPETLDKVIRLIGLLDAFRNHPFLGDRVALKGGTALNLFVFDLPWLSVDIDLNYIYRTCGSRRDACWTEEREQDARGAPEAEAVESEDSPQL